MQPAITLPVAAFLKRRNYDIFTPPLTTPLFAQFLQTVAKNKIWLCTSLQ